MSSFDQDPQKADESHETNGGAHDQEVAKHAPSVSRPPDSVLTKPAKAAKSTPAHTEMVGNSYADEGLACERDEEGGGCFLDAGTRNRVVSLYHGRVNAAHINYMSALNQLGIEELLKKEHEKGEWIKDLLLDVIGVVTSKAAVGIFKLAMGGGHAVEGVSASAAELSHGLASHSEEHFKEGFGMAVGLAKKAATESHADPSTPTAGSEKAVNTGYVALLKDQAGAIFENIREGMLASVDDAQLLVLFESFGAANHTVTAYKAALSAKLQRFKQSGLAKIGVTMNDEHKHRGYGDGLEYAWQHERHAYWVIMPTGRRLGMYRRAHAPARDPRPMPGGPPVTQFDILAEKMQRGTNEDGFVFDGFVAGEFAEAAAKMHAAKWGYLPRERVAGPYELTQMGAKDEKQ